MPEIMNELYLQEIADNKFQIYSISDRLLAQLILDTRETNKKLDQIIETGSHG